MICNALLYNLHLLLDPVPERPISTNPGLNGPFAR